MLLNVESIHPQPVLAQSVQGGESLVWRKMGLVFEGVEGNFRQNLGLWGLSSLESGRVMSVE